MQTDFGSGQCATGVEHSIVYDIGECIRKPVRQDKSDSAPPHRAQHRLGPVHVGGNWVLSRLWPRMRGQ